MLRNAAKNIWVNSNQMTAAAPHIIALAIGALSGIIGFVIGMPLPWMLGPMIGVTIAAMAGAPIQGPVTLRKIVIPIIGVMLGSSVSPETLQLLGQWALTMATLPVVLLIMGGLSFMVYRYIGRHDPVTAFYAAMPGGLNEMLIMGEEAGGDARTIALAHSARILTVIFLIALALALVFGISSRDSNAQWEGLLSITWLDYLILGACAAFGPAFGKMLRLPASMVFGPMLLAGITHIAGWITVAPPTIFVIVAQVVMGTVIGSRFVGATLKEVGKDLGLSFVASVLMLITGALLAVGISWLVGMPIAQIFLAFAPGGITEMSLLTLAINQDVAFVSVAHLVRIAIVIAVAPLVFGLSGIGRFTKPPKAE